MLDTMTELISYLFKNSQGQTQLLLIFILLVVYITEKVIKYLEKGSNSNVIEGIQSINNKLKEMRKDNENNFSIVIRTLNETLTGLYGRLDTNHVFIVVEIYSTAVKNSLYDIIENIFYDEELTQENKNVIIERMQRRFETVIHEADQQFYELPDVNPAITSTKEKKNQFKQENIYESIFEIIIKNKENHPKMKKLVMEILSDSISKWRLR